MIVYWKRQYRGKGEKEAWYLLTNLPSLEEGIEAYQKRMGIEEMFKDFKKGGYNLEDFALFCSKILPTLFYSSLLSRR